MPTVSSELGRLGGERRRAIATVLMFVLGGCVAGATGPSPTDPHASTTTTTLPTITTLTAVDALVGYRECLADHGVVIDVIPLDGLGRPRMADALSGVDLSDRDVLDALESCGHHLSSGALDLSADPEMRGHVQAGLEAFAECVRFEGVSDYPDPVPDFDGLGSPFPASRIPWTDPQLPSAISSCRSQLSTR